MSLATGDLLTRRFEHSRGFGNIAFSGDGKTMAGIAAGYPAKIRLWDLATGRIIGKPFTRADEFDADLAISGDGRTLGARNDSGTIGLWDVGSRLRLG